MYTIVRCLLVVLLACSESVEHLGAVQRSLDQPTGSLDGAGQGVIGGWAYDPDYAGPTTVAIYVDGKAVQVAIANNYRSDLVDVCTAAKGYCAFTWSYAFGEGFGDGTHSVVAYAIGVDSTGAADGQNIALNDGVATTFADGCQYLDVGTLPGHHSSAYEWCEGNGGYWSERQTNTTLVSNSGVFVGVDNAAGGTMFQLRGTALDKNNTGNVFWGNNLTAEHGGASIQLSVYGDDAFMDASNITTCPGPKLFNPIQAQGSACGWGNLNTGVADPVTVGCYVASNASVTCSSSGTTYYTKQQNPYNDSVDTLAVSDLTFEQWVTPLQGYVAVMYRVTTGSSFNYNLEKSYSVEWDNRPQELPAFFTAEGIYSDFYSYTGGSPFQNKPVTTFGPSPTGFLNLPLPTGSTLTYPHGVSKLGCASENWWGVCDADATRCVTVATFDLVATEGWIASNPLNDVEGYITPIGPFAIGEKFSRMWTVYVFPTRYDQIPYTSTQTTRQIIYGLAQAAGVSGRKCPD
jgi:hypothetical protein